jgi:hypothetical protein
VYSVEALYLFYCLMDSLSLLHNGERWWRIISYLRVGAKD